MAKHFTLPPLGTPLNPSHRLNHGLVGYWGFGEGAGSKTQDLSGNGNHGTLTNMVQGATSGFTGGKFGGAMNFDGTNDFVNIADASSLDVTGALTFSAWVNVTTAGNGDIASKIGASGNRSYQLLMLSNGKIDFELTANGVSFVSVAGATNIGIRQWQHIAAVFKPSTSLEVFLNGSSDGIVTSSIPASIFNSSANLEIGTEQGGTTNRFNGSISEVRIYNRALSAQEIQQLYTDPFCMYERLNIFTKFIQRGSFFFSKK